jgi:hypothetical protein
MAATDNSNDYAQDNATSGSKSSMLFLSIGGGVIVIAIILLLVLGRSEEAPEPVVVEVPIVTEPDPEPGTEPEPVIEEEYLPSEPVAIEEPIVAAEPEPEPEPLDISDGAVKTALLALSQAPDFARLLVDEDLLSRFVVFTENLANQELADNHHLLRTPENSFRVYRQAGKEWIDSASYQRYSTYVEVLDSIEAVKLLELYEIYKPTISEIYAEIGDPDENFDYRLLDAIDHLLDTPEIPVPVEVYTDSVMYKFRIDQVEDLTAPQKQLLRTGPENMRLIKAKLREIKSLLDS